MKSREGEISLLRLYRNENFKLFHKASTWVMLIIIPLVVCFNALGVFVLSDTFTSVYNSEDRWKEDLQYQISDLESVLNQNGISDAEKLYYQSAIDVYKYQLENEFSPQSWQAGVLNQIVDMRAAQYLTEDYQPGSQKNTEYDRQITEYFEIIKTGDWQEYIFRLNDNLKKDEYISASQKEIALYINELRLQYDIAPAGASYYDTGDENWKNDVLGQIESNLYGIASISDQKLADLRDGSAEEQDPEELRQENAVLLRCIEKNMVPANSIYMTGDARLYLESSTSVTTIMICIVVIASSIVSSEFTSGTAKLLVCAPYKRRKILFSKYGCVLTTALLMVVWQFLLVVGSCFAFNGFQGVHDLYIFYANGGVREVNYILWTGFLYVLRYIEIIMYATLAFTISVLVRKNALAISVSLVLAVAGNMIMSMVSAFANFLNYSGDGGILRFILMACTDLTQFVGNNTPMYQDLTLPFALLVLGGYYVILLLTAFDSFAHRDIKR